MLSTSISNSDGRPGRERAAQEQRIQNQVATANAGGVVIINIGDDYHDLFEKREIRHQFIKYVYMILCTQLLYTAGIVSFFKYYQPAFAWLITMNNMWVWIGIMIGYIVLLMCIMCCEPCRKTFPLNFILLLIFTSLLGFVLAFIVVHHRTDAVLLALGCTVAVVLALTIFACQTKCDFTVCWGIGLVFAIVFIFMGIAVILIPNKILHIVYSSVGVLLFSFYLIIDTQMIIGGKAKFPLAPDEYILGAICLYIDVIMIFLHILQLIQLSQ